jgi:hypothetical protein
LKIGNHGLFTIMTGFLIMRPTILTLLMYPVLRVVGFEFSKENI